MTQPLDYSHFELRTDNFITRKKDLRFPLKFHTKQTTRLLPKAPVPHWLRCFAVQVGSFKAPFYVDIPQAYIPTLLRYYCPSVPAATSTKFPTSKRQQHRREKKDCPGKSLFAISHPRRLLSRSHYCREASLPDMRSNCNRCGYYINSSICVWMSPLRRAVYLPNYWWWQNLKRVRLMTTQLTDILHHRTSRTLQLCRITKDGPQPVLTWLSCIIYYLRLVLNITFLSFKTLLVYYMVTDYGLR